MRGLQGELVELDREGGHKQEVKVRIVTRTTSRYGFKNISQEDPHHNSPEDRGSTPSRRGCHGTLADGSNSLCAVSMGFSGGEEAVVVVQVVRKVVLVVVEVVDKRTGHTSELTASLTARIRSHLCSKPQQARDDVTVGPLKILMRHAAEIGQLLSRTLRSIASSATSRYVALCGCLMLNNNSDSDERSISNRTQSCFE